MPNLIKLMQVVGTFEVSPIFTVNQDDPWVRLVSCEGRGVSQT